MNLAVVDLGKEGWIVFYVDGEIIDYPMPVKKDPTGLVSTVIVDRDAIYKILDDNGFDIDYVFVEVARTSAKQSSKGNGTIRINEREAIYPFVDYYSITRLRRIKPSQWAKWVDSQNGFKPNKADKKQRSIHFCKSKNIDIPVMYTKGGKVRKKRDGESVVPDGFTDCIAMLYYAMENLI